LNAFEESTVKDSKDIGSDINGSETRAEPVKIWRARKYIAEHSEDRISLKQVAIELDMNATHLSEKFKEVTGINFVDYVARTRFIKARALLDDAKLRISEIAFAVGFQSLSQFNRVFKKFTGKSPTLYRESALKRKRH
jgi:AraC-like DNA-binding protein